MNVESIDNPNRSSSQDTARPGTNRVNGVFDVPAPGRIVGWAIDRADPDAAVNVEIYQAGQLIATSRADRERPDLERAGLGTGRYGFSAEIDPPVEPGMAFTLSVQAVTGDGVSGPLRATGAASPSTDPARIVVERIYERVAEIGEDLERLRDGIEERSEDAAWQEITEILERIEIVQARLDLADSVEGTAASDDTNSGLRWAVIASLAIGVAALALGLWSVFA